MTIPKTKRDEWKLLYIHGDMKLLAEFSDCSVPTVRTALKGGYCGKELAQKISDFYRLREMEVNKILRTPQVA